MASDHAGGAGELDFALVIPTKDSANWLSDVLRSHRLQLPNAEIVVVDDGSRDGTADLLDQVLARELDLTVIRNAQCQGQWRSTIRGCLSATSPLLLTIDDDALLRYAAVAEAVSFIDRGADVVYLQPHRAADVRWRSAGSVGFRLVARVRGFPPDYARATSTRLLRSELIQGAGAVPLEVHLARQNLDVAVLDDAVEKIPESVTRYNLARLIAHGYMHLRPAVRQSD